jgi:Cu(I)/Ag(I) efflux system protein CusF
MDMSMRLILSLLLALSLPAYSPSTTTAPCKPAATQAAPLSDGTVKKIDKAAGEVVIQHGQLDSIGMPPMTMAFGVADKAWLNKLKPGDKNSLRGRNEGRQCHRQPLRNGEIK